MASFRVKTLVFLSLICLAITGCTFQVYTKINEDGSGEAVYEVGFTDEENLCNGTECYTSVDDCIDFFGKDVAISASSVVTFENRGGKKWCVLRVTFESVEELDSFYDKGIGIEANTIVIKSNTITYNVPLQLGDGLDDESTWTLVLPGEIQDNNADKLIGNTLTWKLNHPLENLYAVSKFKSSESHATQSLGTYLANNLFVVLIGLVASLISIWVFIKERK